MAMEPGPSAVSQAVRQWSSSLAGVNATDEQVQILLQLCSQTDEESQLRGVCLQRRIVERVTPLLKFLERSGGKHAEVILPEVVKALAGLKQGWLDADSNPATTYDCMLELLTSTRNILLSETMKLSWRQYLSAGIGDLLTHLLQQVLLPAPTEPGAESNTHSNTGLTDAGVPTGSPAHTLLRVLTRAPVFASRHGALPILPVDALAILAWLVKSLLGRGDTSDQPQTAAAMPAGLLTKDDKPLVLMSRLTRSMLCSIPGQLITPVSPAKAIDAKASASPATADAAAQLSTVLPPLVGWACSVVRATLAKVLQPDSGSALRGPRIDLDAAHGTAQATASSGAITRAAAKLAAAAMQGLLHQPETRDSSVSVSAPAPAVQGKQAESHAQLQQVISVLMDLIDTCVGAAAELSPQSSEADRVLAGAASVVEDCRPLLSAAASILSSTGGAAAIMSRLKQLTLAAAALVSDDPLPPAANAGVQAASSGPAAVAGSTPRVRGWWEWDVSRPLYLSYTAAQGAGWGAQHLCCSLTEALAVSLDACATAGSMGVLQALLLLPLPVGTASGEVSATGLAMARVFVLRRGDPDLGTAMLPLITDVLAAGSSAAGTLSSGPSAASSSSITVQQASASSVRLPASVYGSLAFALAGMAAASACTMQDVSAWTYQQAVDVLLRLGREPDSHAGRALATGTEAGAAAGPLAAVLLQLAYGLAEASSSIRRDVRQRLLNLFSDLGLRVGSGGSSGARAVAEMRALLPALAAACQNLGSDVTESLRQSATHPWLNSAELGHGKLDAQLVKLLRSFWLYCGLLKLGPASLPELHAACGSVAAATPLMVSAGVSLGNQAEVIERLKAEFSERLRLAGADADPVQLRKALQAAMGSSSSSAAGTGPALPPDPCRQANILVLTTCELARVAAAPLQADGIADCPIDVSLQYLQLSQSFKDAEPLYAQLVERCFIEYTGRLIKEAAAASAAASPAPGRASSTNISSTGTSVSAVSSSNGSASSSSNGGHTVEACVEGLALGLIRHLGGASVPTGGAAGGVRGWSACVVATCHKLLKRLTAAFPSLYWSHACMEGLLGMLEAEEGDHPINSLHALPSSTQAVGTTYASSTSIHASSLGSHAASNPAWTWLQAWVYAGAAVAPSRTEALLHTFMQSGAQGDTLSRTAPSGVHHREGELGTGAIHALGGPSSSALWQSGAFSSGLQASAASTSTAACSAALRRAGDLLAVCAEARRRAGSAPGAALGGGDSAMSLCRKLYFAGTIGSAADALLNASGSGVAQALADSLRSAAAGRAAVGRDLEARYMAAAAYLAGPSGQELAGMELAHDPSSSSDAEDGQAPAGHAGAAREACYQLIGALCTVPVKRFTPATMSLAVFAWTWVTSAGRGWLLPMASRIAAAWSETVDLHVGLFAGPWGSHDGQTADGSQLDDGLSAALGSEQSEACAGAPIPSAAEASLLSGLAAHAQWVGFLYELWAAVGEGPGRARSALEQVYLRLLAHALQAPATLSTHPAAAAARFRLLRLALAFCSQASAHLPASSKQWPLPLALLYDRTLRAGLAWFETQPTYSARMTQAQADDQAQAVDDFAALLKGSTPPPALPSSMPGHPVWGTCTSKLLDIARLLVVLCQAEADRLRVWARPLASPILSSSSSTNTTSTASTGQRGLSLSVEQLHTAWQVHPRLAVAVAGRQVLVPAGSSTRGELVKLLAANAWDPRVQCIPEAAMLLVQASSAGDAGLHALATWAVAGGVDGLQLMAGPLADASPAVKAYAIRCLHAAHPEKLAFFLPQLVQSLRHDKDGTLTAFLKATAATSDLFLHQLLWALATEQRPPDEAFNPEVKRSGWQPPKDTGLWVLAGKLREQVETGLSGPSQEYWAAEDAYFERVTSISGVLKKLEKDERRAHIAKLLAEFTPPRTDLYIPTNPDCIVLRHIPKSGTPMQSAAKRNLACIFKVGDDVRQDVLALQVISLMRDAFQAAGLGAYLHPYGCIPTGYERGVIEVVPHTKSRAALGELSDSGLYEIFQVEFGAPGSEAFEAARRAFIASAAGYAVASFLLQAKDRHNGNLLISSDGHLVHIDFGFILEISPGGNMGFESAAFKLSHEMTQLLDPGGSRTSPHWRLFEELVVRGYLAARTVAEPILATVALMAESGLPCFSRGAPLANLRRRFNLDMSDRQAASFMRGMVDDAYQKWTTGFYDYIQALQNRIPY